MYWTLDTAQVLYQLEVIKTPFVYHKKQNKYDLCFVDAYTKYMLCPYVFEYWQIKCWCNKKHSYGDTAMPSFDRYVHISGMSTCQILKSTC